MKMPNTPLHIPSLLGKFDDYRREIWGDSFNWDFVRSPHAVEYLAIHHSVTYTPQVKPERAGWTPRQYADEIADIHKNKRGWGGVGYHFIIAPDGTVLYVGDVSTGRANVKGNNEKVIGICLVGDFTKHLPTDEQIMSTHKLVTFFIDDAAAWPNIFNNDDSLKGHKELNKMFGLGATACPGESWPNDMRSRILQGIPYSPQIPTPPDAPEPPSDTPPSTPPHPEDPPSDEKDPDTEAVKELARYLVLFAVSYLVTKGVDAAFLEYLQPELIMMVSTILTLILRTVDKWIHEWGKKVGKEGWLGIKGLTGF